MEITYCKDCFNYNPKNCVCKGRPGEPMVLRSPDEYCNYGRKKIEQTRFYIDNFCDDFNYKNIAFDITNVDKQALMRKLKKDYVNHLYELENANYIAIWNCDLQGFETEDDIFFDTDNDRDYKLCKLVNIGEAWFYDIVDENKKIAYWKRFNDGNAYMHTIGREPYRPTCPRGYTDCIYDPAYIKYSSPEWYKKLYGDMTPEEAAHSKDGCYDRVEKDPDERYYCYDDEDK